MPLLGPDGRPLPPTRDRLMPGQRISRDVLPIEQLVAGLERPDEISIQTYEKMVLTDETLAMGLEFVVLAAVSRLGEYTHENETVQGFVRENFEALRGSIRLAVADLLGSALWAGWGCAEKVWRADGRQWRLASLPLIDPVESRLEVYDGDGPGHGELERVHQRWGTGWYADIPGHKVVHFANRRPGLRPGNPYGVSRLKAAYKWWWPKDKALAAWVLALRRYGTPLGVAKILDLHGKVTDSNGEELTRGEYMMRLLTRLDTGSGLVLEQGQEEIEFVKAAAAAIGKDFEGFGTFANRMMLRALMVPPLLGEGQEGGSRAMASEHFDLFILGLEGLLHSVTEVLLEQLVREMVELNFGPQSDWGHWATLALQPDDQELLSRVFFQLGNGGWISPEVLEDLNLVRERMGFPEVEEGSPLLLPRPATLPAPAGEEDLRRKLSASLP